MRGPFALLRALCRLPVVWRAWVCVLGLLNMLLPAFYFGHPEARMVLAVFVAQAFVMYLLFVLQGFTRLLGLAHFGWLGLIGFLWPRLWGIPAGSVLGLWLRALILVDGLSLSIDAVDVLRFVGGDRSELGSP